MATPTRIYLVEPKLEGDKRAPLPQRRLVRATHPAHALRHVADGAYIVAIASQDELVDMIEAGIKPESIKAEQTELPNT